MMDPTPPLTRRTRAELWRGLAVFTCVTTLAAAALLPSCIVVEGRQGDRIRFPLDAHAEFMQDCDLCHADVDGDDITADTRRGLERQCLTCHAEKAQDCGWCHSDVSSAGVFPSRERHLTFSHATHNERTYGDCGMCHDDVHEGPPADGSDPVVMPAHEECFQCHEMEQFYDDLECRNCHEAMFEYGLAPFETFAHGPGWLEERHAEFVRNPANAATCNQCHEPNYCDACHAGTPLLTPYDRMSLSTSRSFIHPGDYVHRHMWDARADAASCSRCHQQNFCVDCHEVRGISEPAARTREDGFRFHGAGVLVPGSPDYHGTAARRDIMSCAACHTEGSSGNCVDCHAVGAFGGNPHPPGFSSRLSRTGAPVCRLCHPR